MGPKVNELTHIDLFSGIGGFAVSAAWAGFRTVAFCEIEPYCQKVIQKNFGAALADAISRERPQRLHPERGGWEREPPALYTDIHRLDGTRYAGVDLLTAGVPCQPASCAGKRRGKEDDRWLWPQALRILREAKPAVAVFENPLGLLSLESGMVFEELLSEMESYGYEVPPPLVIPACAVGAGHRRYRIAIVAYNQQCQLRQHPAESERRSEVAGFAADIDGRRRKQCDTGERRLSIADENIVWPETDFNLLRTVHGLPRGLDRNRRARIHALGNAVVPAQWFQILKPIADALIPVARFSDPHGRVLPYSQNLPQAPPLPHGIRGDMGVPGGGRHLRRGPSPGDAPQAKTITLK